MKSWVIDTSALLRLYVPDGPLPDGIEEIIEQTWRGEALLFAPELALVESAQVLHKKTRAGFLTSEDADKILAALLDLPLEVIGHRELLPQAVEMARSLAITVYDAVFVALATDRGCTLVTADEQLARACLNKSPSASGPMSLSGR